MSEKRRIYEDRYLLKQKLTKREKEILQKIESLNAEISHWRQKETEITRIRQEAIKESELIKEAGLKDAEKLFRQVEERAQDIRMRTEEWLTEVINQVQETERQKSHFMTAFKSALDSHYDLIKNDQELSEPLSQRLDNFLKTVTQSPSSH